MRITNDGKKYLTSFLIFIILFLSSVNLKIIANPYSQTDKVVFNRTPLYSIIGVGIFIKEFGMQKEIWKDIKNYEGFYQVSNLGRIKSLDRVRKNRQGYYLHGGKIMTLVLDRKGYSNINLMKKGKIRHCKIHRLVAQVFLKNENFKPTVNHKNNNKSDNSVENLEWATYQENMDHAIKNGYKNMKGENHPMAKLKAIDILMIRKLCRYLLYKNISEIFGVGVSCISEIATRKAWGHINEDS